jgi:hypothetical protein
MATTQTPHSATVIDTWLKKFRGRVFTIHPVASLSSAGSNLSVTADDAASTLLAAIPSSSLYTPGTFTVPSDATPAFVTGRKATYTPMSWSITCKANQATSLQFNQYFVLMDAATTPIVHYVSASIVPAIILTPGGSYTEALTLETD